MMTKHWSKCLVFFAMVFVLAPNMASAQVLDDTANLKVLKAKSMMLRLNKRRFEEASPKSNLEASPARVGCGHVDIGNQYTDNTLSGDINVVVVGDIVNTGNECRGY